MVQLSYGREMNGIGANFPAPYVNKTKKLWSLHQNETDTALNGDA